MSKEGDTLLREIAQRLDDGDSKEEVIQSLVNSGLDIEVATKITNSAYYEYSNTGADTISRMIKEATDRLENGNSKDEVIEYFMREGISLKAAKEVISLIPSKKNMQNKIFNFLFWLLLLFVSSFVLLISIIEADDLHAVKSIAILGISFYAFWIIGKKLKSSYRRMIGKETVGGKSI